ncbi:MULTISPECIES: 3-oxoacyl-ACP reductase FabG [unclassified Salinivibrio]|uniref:3-oxoacyl-ACP reductase FabG n=1 Tax=unclassified Salinivibrio TaxID=2636825 RepID=UPI0009869429|nr:MULTISPECIES: 3-oxoacyl-ACP reductase FabG [unclassified Salinivibrio]OOF11411.1 beta-ketoacyl-ACP reductase [Salinivibrio sp. PR919]OOF17637.1 beta-ketoacyl-ACP reductase [Salinivibrio sp. PR932]
MLAGKHCVITGAAQGIGRAIVETFIAQGAEKIYAIDLNMDAMTDWQDHAIIQPIALNVCDRDAVSSWVQTLHQQNAPVDVLVNNAGITRDNLLTKMTEGDWDAVIDVNLKGVFSITQAIAPLMLEQEKGAIVTLSSVVGTDGNIGQTNYAASKGGVIAMTKTWSKELARHGAKIRANCVAPGFIETPMTANLPEKVIDMMKAKTPLGRMGTAQDIADAICFLASDKASFITGQTLKVDGGLVI